ncbi:class I SAM-dependent methyltransferase [Actinacidiphila sp. DG2A-62]|uniref:SAM-dependent methyltransferase n=1 Tax=Actinacidiphila sp. DG2A-62 TaxID=3108821 RepID=UPI002DBB55B6|nr:class I SAM-dependent methyltransferase [Actinacidiphila sp. DG2A-62]MEC3994622.1 class I SAM-dependent methyltransferase [Actinacidiphila sp. DG2A-62]
MTEYEHTPQTAAQTPAGISATPVPDAAGTARGDGPPRLTRLDFHGPLSDERAARMVARLARTGPRSVLDVGCGWGELMLRLLAAAPGATGTGLDLNAEDLDRGRRNAADRALDDRAAFVEESALGTARGPADVVLCLGASQALSQAPPPRRTPQALAELRRLVAPGGRVLLGEGFWERTPRPAELARMWPGAGADDHVDLGALVGLAVDAGFRPEWTETANADEWDDFESGYQADVEEWLAAHPGHPLADETRRRVDAHRAAYTAYRGVLGIAYLTLVPVAG